MDLAKLHHDSRDLLERLADRLPQREVDSYRKYSSAGEWVDLINLLCASLVQMDIWVTPDERDALRDLLYRFQIPMEDSDFINTRDETLASLNVIGE